MSTGTSVPPLPPTPPTTPQLVRQDSPVAPASANEPRAEEHIRAVSISDGPALAYPPQALDRRTSESEPTRRRNLSADIKTAPEPDVQVAASGGAKAPASVSKLYKVLTKGSARLAKELASPADKEAPTQAVELQKLMQILVTAAWTLLDAGEPYEDVLQKFSDATEVAFHQLGGHGAKPAIEGMARLDAFADDGNRDIVSRHLAQTAKALQLGGPTGLHRQILDAERARAPKPTKLGGKVKAGILKGWRATKRTVEKVGAEKGPEATKARSVEEARELYRGRVHKVLTQMIELTQPGVMKSDRALTKLGDRLSSAHDHQNSTPMDMNRWLAGIEDFLVGESTASLLALTNRLLETVPSRPHIRGAFNELGHALQAVLKLRPGCEAFVRRLEPNLCASVPFSDTRSWRINRLNEMLIALSSSSDAQVDQILLDDLADTSDWNESGMRDFQKEAMGRLPLSQQKHELVLAKLRKASEEQHGFTRLIEAMTKDLADFPPPPDLD